MSGTQRDLDAVRTGYDAVCDEYARRFQRELDRKPFDRALLDRFAETMRGAGRVADIGCGPGHISRYLHERGVDVVGVDLSPGMIARARKLHPEIAFEVGDMLELEAPDGAWAGVAAFYSIIHVPREQVVRALGEMLRTLRPRGELLLACHLGEGTNHLSEWWGTPVEIDFHFFERQEMEQKLARAGFRVDEVLEREPYPDVEAQTRRGYFRASRAD